ncbi:MAG TPA: low molecular weight phosphatase family protein [Clostridiales bacterium]|mgnify:FL=1|nr:low molecular weight phosphatase family protein [Clostridiales bacterium]
MRILFVCTGNTCRSPMAAVLMRRELDKRGREDIIIDSAGLAAFGQPASPNAIAVIRELDERYSKLLENHKSSMVTREMLDQSDVIAVMSNSHARGVIALGADPGRVHILSADGFQGIEDPFGGDIEVYRRTRDQLEKAVKNLADAIFKNAE